MYEPTMFYLMTNSPPYFFFFLASKTKVLIKAGLALMHKTMLHNMQAQCMLHHYSPTIITFSCIYFSKDRATQIIYA